MEEIQIWNNNAYKKKKKKKNDLDCLIDPTFRNINRLFVLSFKNGNDDPTKDSFDKYYMPLIEVKYFNALMNDKPFFDQPVKNKQETWKTYSNAKKRWLYNRKLVRLFVS